MGEGCSMRAEAILNELRSLPVEERLKIADTIYEEAEVTELSAELKALLDERMAAHEANPECGASYEEVLREARARWGR
jgi:putative addiction module component (TIGR02574 family)